MSSHVFWPDNISVLDVAHVAADHILFPSQVTDSYLLALAVANSGALATLDRRMTSAAVREGRKSISVLTPT